MCPKVGVAPNALMLNLVISACCQDSKTDRALAFLKLGQAKFGIKPTRVMYANLITSYGAQKDLSKCLTLYRNMAFEDRIPPGPTSFVALLSAYAYSSEYEAILRMLKNPASHGIPRQNRHFFETAIEALEEARDDPLESIVTFDWTKLQDTTETLEELEELKRGLNPQT